MLRSAVLRMNVRATDRVNENVFIQCFIILFRTLEWWGCLGHRG